MAGSGLAVGLLAPGAGGLAAGIYAVVSTLLLWAALPVRPDLRGTVRRLDPVLAPVVLLAAGLVTPFVVGEVELQNTSGDEHAHMAHYFDMAWVSVALVLVGALAAVVPAARRRVLWLTGWPRPDRRGAHRLHAQPHLVAAGHRPGHRRHRGRPGGAGRARGARGPLSTSSLRLPVSTGPATAAAHPDGVRGGALAGSGARGRGVRAGHRRRRAGRARRGRLGVRRRRQPPVDVVVGITYPLVGALVLAGRRPSRRLGWLLLGRRRRRRADGRRDDRRPAGGRPDAHRPAGRAPAELALGPRLPAPGHPAAAALPRRTTAGAAVALGGRHLGGRDGPHRGWARRPSRRSSREPSRCRTRGRRPPSRAVLFPPGAAAAASVLAGIASLVVRLRRSSACSAGRSWSSWWPPERSSSAWRLAAAAGAVGHRPAGRRGGAAAGRGRRGGDPAPAVRPRPRGLPGAGPGAASAAASQAPT
jgi:hypothetical protein